MSKCWNLVLQTTMFRAAVKSISLTPLGEVVEWRLNYPTVEPKIPSCPTFALKSPRTILMSLAGHLSYRTSKFT